ncbi:2Fe-2S ferredoxin-like protein [Klebsiella pneumoniae]|uniref:2Fe-2S ferredoxin-like protein n=1 Tax=Klebsiella pneumoniae TaxID=573 RepID=A0A923ENY1_KLEPN|nr:2Fe-2S ferredoxin-like protein [Klebsiella pneumoniae]
MKRIFLKISDTRLECQDEHPSLLAALESHNIDVEYQCREGYCGSCRTRWSPAVDWLTEPLAFIQPGEILPCCCRAKAILRSRCSLVRWRYAYLTYCSRTGRLRTAATGC